MVLFGIMSTNWLEAYKKLLGNGLQLMMFCEEMEKPKDPRVLEEVGNEALLEARAAEREWKTALAEFENNVSNAIFFYSQSLSRVKRTPRKDLIEDLETVGLDYKQFLGFIDFLESGAENLESERGPWAGDFGFRVTASKFTKVDGEVLRLHYVENATQTEIAARLDVSQGTVSNRLARAKHHLPGLAAMARVMGVVGTAAQRNSHTVRVIAVDPKEEIPMEKKNKVEDYTGSTRRTYYVDPIDFGRNIDIAVCGEQLNLTLSLRILQLGVKYPTAKGNSCFEGAGTDGTFTVLESYEDAEEYFDFRLYDILSSGGLDPMFEEEFWNREVYPGLPLTAILWQDGGLTLHPPFSISGSASEADVGPGTVYIGEISGGIGLYESFVTPLPDLADLAALDTTALRRLHDWYKNHLPNGDQHSLKSVDILESLLQGGAQANNR